MEYVYIYIYIYIYTYVIHIYIYIYIYTHILIMIINMISVWMSTNVRNVIISMIISIGMSVWNTCLE